VESKIEMRPETKYFCLTEQTSNYLQKYIIIRKRKIFVGEKTTQDVIALLKKHKEEKFILPCSNVGKSEIAEFLQENKYNYTEAIIYKTVPSNLSDISKLNYDMIAFFSPTAVDSLLTNFPNFKQNKIRIAAFGLATAKAIRNAGLTLDIEAPTAEAPSMTGAIELYIKKTNK
jgi:uroporphyrinogen-III synthase